MPVKRNVCESDQAREKKKRKQKISPQTWKKVKKKKLKTNYKAKDSKSHAYSDHSNQIFNNKTHTPQRVLPCKVKKKVQGPPPTIIQRKILRMSTLILTFKYQFTY